MTAFRPIPRTLQLVHRLEFGGAEILAERFARRFGGPDRVLVACLDGEGPLANRMRTDGFTVIDLQRRAGPLDLGCVRRLHRLIADEKIELVHAHQSTPFLYSLMARGVFARSPRILFTEHGRFFPDRGSWKRAVVQRFLLRKSDLVTAVGETVKRAVVEHEGIPESRIRVIQNGVPNGDLVDPVTVRSSMRKEFGIREDAFVVIHVARLEATKNHRLAVEAFQQVANTKLSAILIIVGDGPERSALEKLVDKLGLRASVVFTGMRDDVPELLAAADVAILTSLSEGVPLSLIEAMNARLPIVATSVGGVQEVVDDRVTGLLVDSGDGKSLADAIVRLSERQEIRQQMGIAGRERAQRRFSEERMFAEFGELLGFGAT